MPLVMALGCCYRRCVRGASLGQQKGRRPFQERRPGGCLSFAGSPALAGSGSRRLAGDLGKTSERLCVAHGNVGEHLAVELHAGERQAVHELRVAHAVEPGRRVDAGDPELAEVALAVAPVAVGVFVGLQQRLLGAPVVRVRLTAEALGLLENCPALLASVDGTLDPGHLPTPNMRFTRGTSSSWRILGP